MPVASLERALHAANDRDLLSTLLDVWRLIPDDLVARMIEDVSWRFERGRAIRRKKAWDALAATRAPEAVGQLLAALNHVSWAGDPIYAGLAKWPADPRIHAAIRAQRRRNQESSLALPMPPVAAALDDDSAALLARLVRPAAQARAAERALLEHIWSDPTDDAPRAVYADWLKER